MIFLAKIKTKVQKVIYWFFREQDKSEQPYSNTVCTFDKNMWGFFVQVVLRNSYLSGLHMRCMCVQFLNYVSSTE